MLSRSIVTSFMIAGLLSGCTSADSTGAGLQPADRVTTSRLLAAFDGEWERVDDLSGEWRTVNDNIMGGRSLGGGEIRDGSMVFAGATDTNGGGFSSVRASDNEWHLAGVDGLGARLRADERRYVFHVFPGLRYGNGHVFCRGDFKTNELIDAADGGASDSGDWQEVSVASSDFVPMVRGAARRDRSRRAARPLEDPEHRPHDRRRPRRPRRTVPARSRLAPGRGAGRSRLTGGRPVVLRTIESCGRSSSPSEHLGPALRPISSWSRCRRPPSTTGRGLCADQPSPRRREGCWSIRDPEAWGRRNYAPPAQPTVPVCPESRQGYATPSHFNGEPIHHD